MATSPDLRQAAQDERDSLKKVQASADLTLAGVAAAAITFLPPLGLVGLIPAVIRWRTTKEIAVQERLVEDPPRFDFEQPAEPQFERVSPNLPEWASPLSDYIESSVTACALEDAMIVSIEKSLGAQDQGESVYSVERAKEAAAFAESTAAALLRVAESQLSLRNLVSSSELFEAEEKLRQVGTWERPASPLDALPDEMALWLFRAGASAEAFRTWAPEEREAHHPFMSFWLPLYENATTKRELSNELSVL